MSHPWKYIYLKLLYFDTWNIHLKINVSKIFEQFCNLEFLLLK